MPSLGPSLGRYNHTAVWTGAEMIVWGGCSFINDACRASHLGNGGGRYNPSTDTWIPTSTSGAPTQYALGNQLGPLSHFDWLQILPAPGITEWSTKIQPSVQAALISNPTANYVIPIYDSMSQFVVPAMELTQDV
jgi:hypothetical protein